MIITKMIWANDHSVHVGSSQGQKYVLFCSDKNIVINYKEVDMLRRYVTEDGKIRPRRQTGTCARHQRALASAIKRSRQIALLPFTGESLGDALRHQ